MGSSHHFKNGTAEVPNIFTWLLEDVVMTMAPGDPTSAFIMRVGAEQGHPCFQNWGQTTRILGGAGLALHIPIEHPGVILHLSCLSVKHIESYGGPGSDIT